MKLDQTLAQSIVNKMMQQLPYNINMMNEKGYIIASGDASRINTRHVGAVAAIQQRKTLTMSTSYGKNGQPGVNMPVFFEGQVIGVIGITGDPNIVVPFASLLRTATELLISQNKTNQLEQQQANQLNQFLYQWAQVKDDIQQHTALILDAKALQIDVLKKRNAIAVQDFNTATIPMDADDHIIVISDDITVILTTHHTTIQRWIKLANAKHFQIGIGQATTKIGISIAEAVKTLAIDRLFKAKHYAYYHDVAFIDALLQHHLPVDDVVTAFETLNQSEMGRELIDTLMAFIENNQNINQTAAALHIHRNTLHYRLERLKTEVGLDPHQLTDLFKLYVGYLNFAQQNND
jgi:carbohydrate diacid regulator